jgi:Secretion system C-terminal sorting domain
MEADKTGIRIALYPNPAKDFVTVEIPEIASKVQVSVYSAEGKMLHSENITQTLTQLDVSYLKPGVYSLRFDAKSETVTKRLVVFK